MPRARISDAIAIRHPERVLSLASIMSTTGNRAAAQSKPEALAMLLRPPRAIPGAKLVAIPGMGHDLPEGAWDPVVDAIVDNARRAGA